MDDLPAANSNLRSRTANVNRKVAEVFPPRFSALTEENIHPQVKKVLALTPAKKQNRRALRQSTLLPNFTFVLLMRINLPWSR